MGIALDKGTPVSNALFYLVRGMAASYMCNKRDQVFCRKKSMGVVFGVDEQWKTPLCFDPGKESYHYRVVVQKSNICQMGRYFIAMNAILSNNRQEGSFSLC